MKHGLVSEQQGRIDEARGYATRPPAGDHREALVHIRAAIIRHREFGNRYGEMSAWAEDHFGCRSVIITAAGDETPGHGSRNRTRTYNLPVNSRLLCQLSYAGLRLAPALPGAGEQST